MGFASASVDNIFKVREVATGRKLRTLKGHSGWVNGVVLSADGRLAVSTTSRYTDVKVWEVTTSRELCTLLGHSDKVRDVALSADGRLAVSASSDTTLSLGCGDGTGRLDARHQRALALPCYYTGWKNDCCRR